MDQWVSLWNLTFHHQDTRGPCDHRTIRLVPCFRLSSEVAPWMSPAKAGLPKSRLLAHPRFSPWARGCRPPRRAEMPRQPIKGLAMGSWREREHLRKARGSGRNQIAHGGNHGIRSPRGGSLSPVWRATSRGGLISRCTGLFQHVLGQPPFSPAGWTGTGAFNLDFRINDL